ncbi:MAG TPA: hypothetical protein VOA19_12850 [Actinomycetes bacterium]|jgi:hypothetical protein|nr:hypothetical protein [Actinomycetes bacterium]
MEDTIGQPTDKQPRTGSDVILQDRGSRRLKGVEGDWELFGVVGR